MTLSCKYSFTNFGIYHGNWSAERSVSSLTKAFVSALLGPDGFGVALGAGVMVGGTSVFDTGGDALVGGTGVGGTGVGGTGVGGTGVGGTGVGDTGVGDTGVGGGGGGGGTGPQPAFNTKVPPLLMKSVPLLLKVTPLNVNAPLREASIPVVLSWMFPQLMVILARYL